MQEVEGLFKSKGQEGVGEAGMEAPWPTRRHQGKELPPGRLQPKRSMVFR